MAVTFPPLKLKQAFNFGGLSVRELAVRTWKQMQDHEISTRAAAVAYYAMLALVPFLALTMTLTAKMLPDLSGRTGKTVGVGNLTVGELEATLQRTLPEEGYKIIGDQIARIQANPPVGLLSIGLVVLLWLTSSLFLAIIDAMNRIYGVTETRPYWKLYLTAFFMAIIQAVIIIGSLVTIVAWPQILEWLGLSDQAAFLATVVQWLVVTIMILLSFTMTFYVAPDAEVEWEWITPGSLIGTIVFLAATLGFRQYVQHFGNYEKSYGALGGVMILMFWFWLTALILLTSGQMNRVIEDASPLGKKFGQRAEAAASVPDLAKIPPQPAT